MTKVSKSDDATEPVTKEVSESPSAVKARPIEIPRSLSVRQLADLLQISSIEIIKQLMRNGIMANINQVSSKVSYCWEQKAPTTPS